MNKAQRKERDALVAVADYLIESLRKVVIDYIDDQYEQNSKPRNNKLTEVNQ